MNLERINKVVAAVHSLSHVWLFATLWITAHQASLSFIIFQSLFKLMSIELVMLSNHLILCCPLLLLPSIFPSIRVFSNESVFCIRWPKYRRFSFDEYSGLISFRIDCFDLLTVQRTLKSLPPAPQFKSINSSALSLLKGFPCGSAHKESACGRPGFEPCVGKISWRKEWLPTPVLWSGEFDGLYSSWGCQKSDMTEPLSLHSLLNGPTLTVLHDYWKNHSCDYMDFCWQHDVYAF